MEKSKLKFATKLIHAGIVSDPTTGAIMTPIYQTSTFQQESLGKDKGYVYSRTSNPTRKVLEENLAAIENGKYGLCFGSGMAAIDAVMKLLKPGDEVLVTDDIYGGSYRLFNEIYSAFGIDFKFISMNEIESLEQHFSRNTKMVWAETPTNPMMTIIDIVGLSKVCKKYNTTLVVDNTFATPYLQNPLNLGADIVMHSVTKFIAGHSDVVLGALICNDEKIAEKLFFIQKSTGAICGPMDSFLALRGLKTLHLRMECHSKNGEIVAKYLREHEKVAQVFWPGFKNNPNYEIAKSQMKDFGGMISFKLKNDTKEAAQIVLSAFNLFALAESLGGVESLVCYPASMTHGSIPEEERKRIGVTDSLIRLSVGIEDVEDLIEDLEKALNQI